MPLRTWGNRPVGALLPQAAFPNDSRVEKNIPPPPQSPQVLLASMGYRQQLPSQPHLCTPFPPGLPQPSQALFSVPRREPLLTWPFYSLQTGSGMRGPEPLRWQQQPAGRSHYDAWPNPALSHILFSSGGSCCPPGPSAACKQEGGERGPEPLRWQWLEAAVASGKGPAHYLPDQQSKCTTRLDQVGPGLPLHLSISPPPTLGGRREGTSCAPCPALGVDPLYVPSLPSAPAPA